jgi:hypothetical protein
VESTRNNLSEEAIRDFKCIENLNVKLTKR